MSQSGSSAISKYSTNPWFETAENEANRRLVGMVTEGEIVEFTIDTVVYGGPSGRITKRDVIDQNQFRLTCTTSTNGYASLNHLPQEVVRTIKWSGENFQYFECTIQRIGDRNVQANIHDNTTTTDTDIYDKARVDENRDTNTKLYQGSNETAGTTPEVSNSSINFCPKCGCDLSEFSTPQSRMWREPQIGAH